MEAFINFEVEGVGSNEAAQEAGLMAERDAEHEEVQNADLEEVKFVREEEEESRRGIGKTLKPKIEKREPSKDHARGNTAAAGNVAASIRAARHKRKSHGADECEKKAQKKVIEIDSSQCLEGYDIGQDSDSDSDDGEDQEQSV